MEISFWSRDLSLPPTGLFSPLSLFSPPPLSPHLSPRLSPSLPFPSHFVEISIYVYVSAFARGKKLNASFSLVKKIKKIL